MTKYLISFPATAMAVPTEDFAAAGEAAREVIREAKAAGVYVFGGGINGDVAPLMVASDCTVTKETYPQTKEFDGGFCVLELPSREAAIQWAAKIAKACRCSRGTPRVWSMTQRADGQAAASVSDVSGRGRPSKGGPSLVSGPS